MGKQIILSLMLSALSLFSVMSQPRKKVYADYHGVRYTRQHDGKLGRWEMYADTERSKTGRKTLCYNADLIDDDGRHNIASVTYPQIGMQSNMDPDYMEYQILSAKAAKIDGFFIEWGFFPHENDELLREMQKVAAKYDFEIGVNWCDAWLYYDWISKIYPEINTREAKTKYMLKCYRYLIDRVFTAPTAPLVKGSPVFYHFGAGATVAEFQSVLSRVKLPEGLKAPVALRRWADWGKLENGKYVPITHSDEMDMWKEIGEIPTAWLPARVRPMDATYAMWDYYALPEDAIDFMKPFRDSIWHSSNPAYVIKAGFAMPGMDNRGCAGWGHQHFFHIPRNSGGTYEQMWQFCLAEKEHLDMMFIASWNDYTEGHEIEPTKENGNRELRITLKYAAEFKGEQADESGLPLPEALFRMRKEVRFLSALDRDVSTIEHSLDEVGKLISQERYAEAKDILTCIEKEVESVRHTFTEVLVHLCEQDINIRGTKRGNGYNPTQTISLSLPLEVVLRLRTKHHIGYLEFEYLDEGREYLFVRSSTSRTPKESFNVVARIRTDNTNRWKKARIELYKENIQYAFNAPAFYLKGAVPVRNLSLKYKIYTGL